MRPVVRSEETAEERQLGQFLDADLAEILAAAAARPSCPAPVRSAARVRSLSGSSVTKVARIRSANSSTPHSRARPAAMIAPMRGAAQMIERHARFQQVRG